MLELWIATGRTASPTPGTARFQTGAQGQHNKHIDPTEQQPVPMLTLMLQTNAASSQSRVVSLSYCEYRNRIEEHDKIATDCPPYNPLLSTMHAFPDRLVTPVSRLWRMLHGIGLERFELLQQDERWVLRGTILHLHDNRPVESRYSITCDSGWHTVSARIEVRDDTQERILQIDTQADHWIANGNPQPQLDGCLDIDLGWSPSTNTLPIRRLNLAVASGSGPVVAAWVKFPELALEPLPQEYDRVADRAYRYSSRGGTFTADLFVDEHGIVQEYKGFWKRVLSEDE